MDGSHTFTRDQSANRTDCSAAETAPARAPEAGANPYARMWFNHGFRVFWHVAGEAAFRDETGKVHPISLATIRDIRRQLWTMARDTTGRQRDRLCILWAEADEAFTDTVRWRQAACGIFLVTEDAA